MRTQHNTLGAGCQAAALRLRVSRFLRARASPVGPLALLPGVLSARAPCAGGLAGRIPFALPPGYRAPARAQRQGAPPPHSPAFCPFRLASPTAAAQSGSPTGCLDARDGAPGRAQHLSDTRGKPRVAGCMV